MARQKGRHREFKRWKSFEKLYRLYFHKMFDERKRQGKTNYWDSADEWFYCWYNEIYIGNKAENEELLNIQMEIEM